MAIAEPLRIDVYEPGKSNPTLYKERGQRTFKFTPEPGGKIELVRPVDARATLPKFQVQTQPLTQTKTQYSLPPPKTGSKVAAGFGSLPGSDPMGDALAGAAYDTGVYLEGFYSGLVGDEPASPDSLLEIGDQWINDQGWNAGSDLKDWIDDATTSGRKLLDDLWRNRPSFEIPDIKLPQFDIPDIKLPEFELPRLPQFDIPNIKLPEFKLPEIKPIPKVYPPPITPPKTNVEKLKGLNCNFDIICTSTYYSLYRQVPSKGIISESVVLKSEPGINQKYFPGLKYSDNGSTGFTSYARDWMKEGFVPPGKKIFKNNVAFAPDNVIPEDYPGFTPGWNGIYYNEFVAVEVVGFIIRVRPSAFRNVSSDSSNFTINLTAFSYEIEILNNFDCPRMPELEPAPEPDIQSPPPPPPEKCCMGCCNPIDYPSSISLGRRKR